MVAVVDFFAGCGGTSLGLQQAGMEIVAAIDNDRSAMLTYQANFPNAHVFVKDIQDLTHAELDLILPDAPLLFAGCAPCQPFSKQNRTRDKFDPRRNLLSKFQEFVEQFLPEYVLVENVPGIQRLEGSGLFQNFIKSLKQHGYSIETSIVSALDYGVPQTRRRLVLVASRVRTSELLPVINHPKRRPAIVRDFIEGLRPLEAGETDPHDPDHSAMQLSPTNLLRIRSTPEGGGREAWPDELILDCHRGHKGHTDVYGRLAWDKPATAMTTRCISYSNGRFGHPSQDRAISLREAALIQTFPASFRFSGTLTERARQVGNAVPPRMAARIGETLLS